MENEYIFPHPACSLDTFKPKVVEIGKNLKGTDLYSELTFGETGRIKAPKLTSDYHLHRCHMARVERQKLAMEKIEMEDS